MDRGHLDIQKLGELLIDAAKKPRDRDGMVISATGALSIAARALNDLADPLSADEHDADNLREDHRQQIEEAQPRLAAYSLETMEKHLGMLRDAVKTGNADVVGRFFDIYVFD